MNTLKYLRLKKGFSQNELATVCDVNLRSLQDYEQGHKRIGDAKAETVYKLSQGLGCSMEDLIVNDGMTIEEKDIDGTTRAGVVVEGQYLKGDAVAKRARQYRKRY